MRVNTDGTITLFTGKVELGRDILHIHRYDRRRRAGHLSERIRVVTGDTEQSPNEGYTVSSMSLETSGNAIRCAAAEVRQIALSVAHEELEAPLEHLTITDGAITDPVSGRSITYWELFGSKKFGVK